LGAGVFVQLPFPRERRPFSQQIWPSEIKVAPGFFLRSVGGSPETPPPRPRRRPEKFGKCLILIFLIPIFGSPRVPPPGGGVPPTPLAWVSAGPPPGLEKKPGWDNCDEAFLSPNVLEKSLF